MSRTPNTPSAAATAQLLPAAATRMETTQNELAVLEQEQNARVRAVAQQLKYEGSTNPDALENGARDAIRRINLGVFELGGYLLMLREACPHSDFLPALERLELEPRVAQQYMQVTKRFANANLNSHLKTLGKTKLLEMLILDDQQVEELELTGQTGELKLDDVATMSVKELRAKLREARAEKQAVEKVLQTKNQQIDKLQLVQVLPPEELYYEIKKKASAVSNDALGAVRGGVRQALIAVKDAPGEGPSKTVFMAALVGQLQAEINALREEFNLPDVSTAADQELAAEVAQWAGQ
ncbi:MAG: hypothetical protein KAY02_01380 [Acidovorax sp.]|nr:hypothetical protein [Acidovorax sp.]